MNISDHLKHMDELTPQRKKRELEICKIVLTEEEMTNTSSLRVGFMIARDRLIETVLKETDPLLYDKIKTSEYKVPIFNIDLLLEDYKRMNNRS